MLTALDLVDGSVGGILTALVLVPVLGITAGAVHRRCLARERNGPVRGPAADDDRRLKVGSAATTGRQLWLAELPA